LIYDPFMGSGTTAKMCLLNNRNYIGSEISEEYCKIAVERIQKAGALHYSLQQSNGGASKQKETNEVHNDFIR